MYPAYKWLLIWSARSQVCHGRGCRTSLRTAVHRWSIARHGRRYLFAIRKELGGKPFVFGTPVVSDGETTGTYGIQSCTSKGIWRLGIGSFLRNSYVSTLCPVAICPYLCTSEAWITRSSRGTWSRSAWRRCTRWKVGLSYNICTELQLVWPKLQDGLPA